MLPHEAVVAGSPEFVDALLPQFTQRLGGAPRVADSPHLASALCQDGARLLVYEHGGREWLSLCGPLRGVAGPELIVVAALPPEHAGDVAEISASASAVVAWRGDARPVLEAASRVMAARESPHAPAPARSAGPVLTPQPVRAVMRPTPTLPPSDATPHPRPAQRPSRPVAVPAAAGEASFDSLFDEESEADEVASLPDPASQSVPPPVHAPTSVWPGTVLSATDGLAVVRAALSGLWPEQQLRPVTERVVAALSAAERAAVEGQALPFDPAPVQRAVGLRWQVAAAIETLPPPGAPIDQGAVQDILVGIDEVLATLKEQSDDAAGTESLRALEAVRHGLVKEAIDLTEALQQVAPAEVVEEITTSRKARRSGVPPVTRMVQAAPRFDEGPRQIPWGLLVVLVVTVIGAAAYHGYRYVNRPGPAASPISGAPSGTVGTVTPRGKVLVAPAGVKLDPGEVEAFKNLERAKGNEVRELLPGTFVVTPRTDGPKSSTGGGGEPAQGAKP